MARKQVIMEMLRNMDTLGRVITSRNLARLTVNAPTHAQTGILFVIHHKGPLGIKELADKFVMTPSAATQLVNGLADEGLLQRREDSGDRRRVLVELTEKGKGRLAEIRKRRQDKIRKILEPVSDLELRQLEKIQKKIINHVKLLWETKHPLKEKIKNRDCPFC